MTIEIAVLISIISVSASVIFGVLGQKRAVNKDIQERAYRDANVDAKLDRIEKGTLDIKAEIKELKSDVKELDERVTLVEAKAEKAHIRIDALTGKKD